MSSRRQGPTLGNGFTASSVASQQQFVVPSHWEQDWPDLTDFLITTTTAQRYPTLAAQTGRRPRRLPPTDPTDPTCTATATALKLRHFTAVILNNHRPPHTTHHLQSTVSDLSPPAAGTRHPTAPHLTSPQPIPIHSLSTTPPPQPLTFALFRLGEP